MAHLFQHKQRTEETGLQGEMYLLFANFEVQWDIQVMHDIQKDPLKCGLRTQTFI